MVKQTTASKFMRLLKFQEPPTVPADDRVKLVIHPVAIGSTGTESYAGYPSEDYLQEMRGSQRADIFDKMRRGDPQIKMCLNAVKNPIKAAMWSIEAADEDDMPDQEAAQADAELVEQVLFTGMDKTWKQLLTEILTLIDFGHSVFEIVDRAVVNSTGASHNGIQDLAFRSQRTIERWDLDPQTGKLKDVYQIAIGDTQRMVAIPAEFLLVFSLDREGSNYEGISMLRCVYGNWFLKNKYKKFNAIGIEKHAIPTPIVTIPAGDESGEQFDNMVAALEHFMCHEKNYLTIPEGWKIDLNTSTYDPQKVETSIDNEDKRMVKAFLANFLELGLNGMGSQALSLDLSDFFLGAIAHIADSIAETINLQLIPRIVQLNRGPRPAYPKLCHSGITDLAGRELAEIVKFLVDARALTADDELEEHLRKRFKLPMADPTTSRAASTPSPAPAAASVVPPSLSERVRLMGELRRQSRG